MKLNTSYSLIEVDYDPFVAGEIDKTVSSIEPQLEIWTSCKIGDEAANLSYNESIAIYLQGNLSLTALEKALQEVVNRHEALRGSFSGDGKMLCISKQLKLDIPFDDISHLGPEDQEQFTREHVKQEALTPFDLQNGPLFRVALFQLNPEKHFLTISAHHIICDGWSFGIIIEDLSALYSAYHKGEMPRLDEAVAFSTYSEAVHNFSKSSTYQKTEEYWVEQYKDHIPELDLPIDFPRPARRTYKSHRADYPLDQELTAAIRKTGGKAGCSLVTTLMVAFEAYLHRITGQQEIVLGLPAAGQSATGNQCLVGHCVNLLPIRSAPKGDLPFIEYLKLRKSKILDDYEHQELTFGSLLRRLNIPRNPARIPLVPVVFNIDMGMGERVRFDGLEYTLQSNPREYETFEIFLNITGSKDVLLLEWSYNTQLFTAATIRRMMDGFETLLRAIVRNPETPIDAIPLEDPQDLLTKLSAWNNTYSSYPKEATLHALISATAQEYAGKTAIRFYDRFVSFKEVEASANQLARLLQDNGVQQGCIVGLAVDRSPEMVISLLAILKIGAAYVPLDPTYPKDRIEFMLEDSSAHLLLTSQKYQGHFHTNAKELLLENCLTALKNYSSEIIEFSGNSHDLAYILYTSGSTGKPKGVMVEHRNLVNLLYSMILMPGISAHDKLLAVTTISFDIAGLELFLPLLTGAELVIADTETSKDGRQLLEIIEKQEISIIQATPSTYKLMLEYNWKKKFDLKILCCGEPMSKDLAGKLIPRCAELYNMYGPTETTIYSTGTQIHSAEETITIGHPIHNTQVYILDENKKRVPSGTVGEIYLGGDGVARGYLNRPELTAEKFVDDPFPGKSGVKMYRTGDLGKFMPDGKIHCLGRIDQQVKIRGYRIELGEIEFNLSKQSGVKEAVVIARENTRGDQQLIAYIVMEAGYAPIPASNLRIALKESLPAFMIPSDFVFLPVFPLTPNGKIDRKNLPIQEQYPTAEIASSNTVAPKTSTEKLIATIWQSVLQVKEVSIHDDFFESGGHSLIAVQLMSEIEKQTGKRLPMATLFENSTIEKLAKQIDTDKEHEWNALVPMKTSGTKDPLYLIHGGGLNVLFYKPIIQYMDDDQPVYGFQALGLYREHTPLYTLEEIAAVYVADLLKANPDGPYCLAGYSFGGIIAFEMAKQLLAMGKKIKFLGIVDLYVGERPTEKKKEGAFSKILRQFDKVPFIIKSLYQYPEDAFNYQLLVARHRLRKLFPFLNIPAPPPMEAYVSELSPYEKQIHDIYYQADENYQMTPIGVKVSLLRVTKRIYYLADLVYLGWKAFAQKGVDVYKVPGDHGTIIRSPNDKEFARTLQKALDNA